MERSIKHSGFGHAVMRIKAKKHCSECGRVVQRAGRCTYCKADRKRAKLEAKRFKKGWEQSSEALKNESKK